jgi:hypothetical protein
MRASSLDVRERVLATIDAGTQRAQVAATFRVSERTISRWLTRRQAGGPIAGGTGPGRRHGLPDALLPAVRAHLAPHPDATIADHLRPWNAQHPAVSHAAFAHAVVRAGWTRQKRPSPHVSITRLPATPSVNAL